MKTIGFAMCGSFCTFNAATAQLRALRERGFEIVPIMSEAAYSTDTRFGEARAHTKLIENICGREIIHTIAQAEPIGPEKLLDALVIAPCTGNTLAKLSCGITDTSVTMAVKAHLRNCRPVIIAVSTNDGLSSAAQNIAKLMQTKNIYFVPYGQDSPRNKPYSLVAHMPQILPTLMSAANGVQLQPIFYGG